MSSDEIRDRLKELNAEDFIWIIYIFIIILSTYSNSLERKYFVNKDNEAKDKYRRIIIFIFLVLVIVYAYFLKDSVDSLRSLKENDTNKKKRLTYLSFIASFLIFVSGLIFLYIALEDEDINIELAFS